MKSVLNTFLFIIILVAIGFIVNYGVTLSEKRECEQWQQQSEEFELFYLTQWQVDQCEAVGVPVDAPVR